MNFQDNNLLMSVHIQNQRVPIVWLWVERLSYSNPGTIQFSADCSKLFQPYDNAVMATAFATLNFCHVIDLLNNISVPHSDGYGYSWWWTSLNFGMLHQGFGGSWVKPPSPKWLKNILPSFALRRASIESLQHQFAIQYPNAKRISLRDLKRWKHESASLSQPANSTLAGTKRKIAHVSSAPALPEEHLQRPRPVQLPNGGELPRGHEINHSNVVASNTFESPTPYDLHSRSTSRIGKPLFGRTDERRPVQPANPSSIPTPATLMSPQEASTGTDEAMSIPQGVRITAPSTEPFGRGPQVSSSFTDSQSRPPETPNLTGCVLRLGSTPLATGGYSSVWRGSLLFGPSDHPDRSPQVFFSIDSFRRAQVLIDDALGRHQNTSCFVYG
jgi:hypothetical protein